MRRRGGYSAIPFAAILMFFVLTPRPAIPTGQNTFGETTLISLPEAETLVYVMSDSVAIRERGRDVVWERITSNAWDQSDYYVFRIVFTGLSAASHLVGSYAVNKHTADVLQIVPEARLVAASKQLTGVQAILRKEHLIGPSTLGKYRYVNPEMGGARLTPKDLGEGPHQGD